MRAFAKCRFRLQRRCCRRTADETSEQGHCRQMFQYHQWGYSNLERTVICKACQDITAVCERKEDICESHTPDNKAVLTFWQCWSETKHADDIATGSRYTYFRFDWTVEKFSGLVLKTIWKPTLTIQYKYRTTLRRITGPSMKSLCSPDFTLVMLHATRKQWTTSTTS